MTLERRLLELYLRSGHEDAHETVRLHVFVMLDLLAHQLDTGIEGGLTAASHDLVLELFEHFCANHGEDDQPTEEGAERRKNGDRPDDSLTQTIKEAPVFRGAEQPSIQGEQQGNKEICEYSFLFERHTALPGSKGILADGL